MSALQNFVYKPEQHTVAVVIGQRGSGVLSGAQGGAGHGSCRRAVGSSRRSGAFSVGQTNKRDAKQVCFIYSLQLYEVYAPRVATSARLRRLVLSRIARSFAAVGELLRKALKERAKQ